MTFAYNPITDKQYLTIPYQWRIYTIKPSDVSKNQLKYEFLGISNIAKQTTIKEAYETSTLSNNRFKAALEATKWDTTFEADGEHYYCMGGFTFTTPSLDPFKITKNWTPSAIFSDGSQIYF